MKRPDCFELGMCFLGDPEETEVRKYVKWLEARVAELEAAQQAEQRCPECDEYYHLLTDDTYCCLNETCSEYRR